MVREDPEVLSPLAQVASAMLLIARIVGPGPVSHQPAYRGSLLAAREDKA
jgi:hypothetical protein